MTQANTSGPVVPGHENTMPKLIPVPIETKGKGFFKALWIWIKSTREWKFESDWDFYLPDIDKTMVIPKDFVFDGASVPKRLRAYLSPVGLLLVPGIIHDYGYRYDYIWVRKSDGSVEKEYLDAGRKHWDDIFFKVGNHVNGVFVINFLATFALALAGWIAWKNNRKKTFPPLEPETLNMTSWTEIITAEAEEPATV
ncbi:MAG: DUF1353 domain-containing protein [Gammaproteobacteria bacterium]|nr:DUF1353 domain-containing protein [Gammaproteobacteria bacterium]